MSLCVTKKSLLLFLATFAFADTHSLVLENDAIVGKDNHYTNGVYYTWMREKSSDFLDVLPFIDLKQKNVAFSISHAIFTPKNKKNSAVNYNDLPYAGYLDLNFLSYKSSQNFFHELGFNLGMIGPSAQADTLQKSFHSLIGHDKPKGWDTQLDDDFIYGISYNIGYKTDPLPIKSLYLDLTTNIKADLGNFYRGALMGANLRLSSLPLRSFSTTGEFIGANESQLLNYHESKNFNWALSWGVFYNAFNYYYVIDEAIQKGYTVAKIDYLVGTKVSLDGYYRSFKTSLYLKSVNIEHKGASSTNEKTGGISVVWKWD